MFSKRNKLLLPVLAMLCGLLVIGRGVRDRIEGDSGGRIDQRVPWYQTVVAGSMLVVAGAWIFARRRNESDRK